MIDNPRLKPREHRRRTPGPHFWAELPNSAPPVFGRSPTCNHNVMYITIRLASCGCRQCNCRRISIIQHYSSSGSSSEHKTIASGDLLAPCRSNSSPSWKVCIHFPIVKNMSSDCLFKSDNDIGVASDSVEMLLYGMLTELGLLFL